jgi:dTDP-4-dehydrorhamnose reductase
MNILVFGRSGQVAEALHRLRPDFVFLGRGEADLNDPVRCASLIEDFDGDAVINAAAYTDVEKAESEEAEAFRINSVAPAAMARAAAKRGMPFITISTDYVFDGSGEEPWKTSDTPNPINVYGKSKLAGEQGVIDAGGRYAIMRTSWVFSAEGRNFVRTMLRLAETRKQLNVVSDQFGGPTFAGHIASALETLAASLISGKAVPGIYHYSGQPDVSWADFAREIFRQARKPVEVFDVASDSFPTVAKRPKNSRLDCSALQRLGIERPDWHKGLEQVINQLGVAA